MGVASKYDTSTNQRLNSCGYNKITTINLEAPVFLRGLLSLFSSGAEDEVRTRDPLLGKTSQAVRGFALSGHF